MTNKTNENQGSTPVDSNLQTSENLGNIEVAQNPLQDARPAWDKTRKARPSIKMNISSNQADMKMRIGSCKPRKVKPMNSLGRSNSFLPPSWKKEK